MADTAEAGGADALREELPPTVDELPPPFCQARPHRTRRGRSHSPSSPPSRKPVHVDYIKFNPAFFIRVSLLPLDSFSLLGFLQISI